MLSCVWLFAIPWTVAHQAPLFMEFSRQEYWSGLPFSPPEDLPDPGIEPASPALAGGFCTASATWEAPVICCTVPPSYVALWDSKSPHRPTSERVSWCLETFPPSWPPPWDGSPSLTLLSLFLSFIVCPTSFWREWTAFLVPGVLCQHSEVVLWNLLSVQMIFQWICGGESDFPILFLHHLRTTPHPPTKHFWNLSSLPMPDCESCLQVSEHHCTSFPFL